MLEINETALVKLCLEWLEYEGYFVWRNNTGAFVAVSENMKRRFHRYGKLGSSDIIGVFKGTGQFLAIECKVGKNKPTDAQHEFLEAIRASGGIALIVYSLEDLQEQIRRVKVYA